MGCWWLHSGTAVLLVVVKSWALLPRNFYHTIIHIAVGFSHIIIYMPMVFIHTYIYVSVVFNYMYIYYPTDFYICILYIYGVKKFIYI